ncbi:MAG: phospholipase A [Oligoflexus sp.]
MKRHCSMVLAVPFTLLLIAATLSILDQIVWRFQADALLSSSFLFKTETDDQLMTINENPPVSLRKLDLGLEIKPLLAQQFAVAPVVPISYEITEGYQPLLKARPLNPETYAIAGSEDIKIQFSFLHQFFQSLPIYGSYTFRGFWLQQENSAPFKDINHHPDLFFRVQDMDIGIEHESNGTDNDSVDYQGVTRRSRSLQRFYIRPSLQLGTWTFVAKASAPIYVQGPTDYHDYMGFIDLGIRYYHPAFEWQSYVRRGTKGGRIESNLSLDPIWWFDSAMALKNRTKLMIQYFDGYADNLLDYNKTRTNLRVGLRFIQ